MHVAMAFVSLTFNITFHDFFQKENAILLTIQRMIFFRLTEWVI